MEHSLEEEMFDVLGAEERTFLHLVYPKQIEFFPHLQHRSDVVSRIDVVQSQTAGELAQLGDAPGLRVDRDDLVAVEED